PTRAGTHPGPEGVATLPQGRPAPRGAAPDDRRAQRPRSDGRAHAAPWGELRQTLGRGHARGGADRGGRPRAQPRIRYPDEPRADAGGGAGAVNGGDRPWESSMPVTAKLSLTDQLVEGGDDRGEA